VNRLYEYNRFAIRSNRKDYADRPYETFSFDEKHVVSRLYAIKKS